MRNLTEQQLIEKVKERFGDEVVREKTLRDKPIAINYFGRGFESQVYHQIKTAARLPVAEKAAILPDGHPWICLASRWRYGLRNPVSPSFVGYDIACRMTCIILDISPKEFMAHRLKLAKDMRAVSRFGHLQCYPNQFHFEPI